DVVEDVLEVDVAEVAAPLRQRPREEVVEALVPELPHPVRLVLVRGDRVDQLVAEAPAGLEEVVLGDGEAVLDRVVGADPLDDLGLAHRHHDSPPVPSLAPTHSPTALLFVTICTVETITIRYPATRRREPDRDNDEPGSHPPASDAPSRTRRTKPPADPRGPAAGRGATRRARTRSPRRTAPEHRPRTPPRPRRSRPRQGNTRPA